jgi:hypothetical protein
VRHVAGTVVAERVLVDDQFFVLSPAKMYCPSSLSLSVCVAAIHILRSR